MGYVILERVAKSKAMMLVRNIAIAKRDVNRVQNTSVEVLWSEVIGSSSALRTCSPVL